MRGQRLADSRPSAPALQTAIAAEFSDDAVLSNPLPVKLKGQRCCPATRPSCCSLAEKNPI